jgi:Helix-turn-helix domain
MDERLQFVARRLAGEPMADLCREFGISRKTGYKIFDRYQECGIQGLTDRSPRPYRYANQLPFQVENFVLNVKHTNIRVGAPARSASVCYVDSLGFRFPPRAPSMPCSIAMAWWSAAVACVAVLRAPSSPAARTLTSSGGFIGRTQTSPHSFTPHRKRASGKALSLTTPAVSRVFFAFSFASR